MIKVLAAVPFHSQICQKLPYLYAPAKDKVSSPDWLKEIATFKLNIQKDPVGFINILKKAFA